MRAVEFPVAKRLRNKGSGVGHKSQKSSRVEGCSRSWVGESRKSITYLSAHRKADLYGGTFFHRATCSVFPLATRFGYHQSC
jgi:hypothetical protein